MVASPAPSVDVDAAWQQYLEATRNAIGYRYDEVEPWAWDRLQRRLEKLTAAPGQVYA